MANRIDRGEFIKQSAMATVVFSASPTSLLSAGQESVRAKTVAEIGKETVQKFVSRLRGLALLPGDRGYEAACRDWTGQIRQRPGLVVRCTSTEDIVASVNFARDWNLALGVRSGGHGLRCSEGGMLVNLSAMKKITVNQSARVARAQPGVTHAELDNATHTAGLAAVLGECPSVGISGFTLGGGLGRLMGEHGALCDNLLSAEVVTAEGRVLRANATENADLFWAIRGGGGNFGIATSLEYRLHPVGQVLSGTLQYPISAARRVLRFFRDYMLTAPDPLDALIEIGRAILQYAHAQEPTVVVNVCCGGDPRTAEETLRPLRAFGPPTADTIRRMSYLDAQGLGDLTALLQHTTSRYSGYTKSGFVTELADPAIDALVAHCEEPPSGTWSVAFDHYLHGAICRVPESEMAYSLRQNGYSFRLVSFEEKPAPSEAAIAWVKSLNEALEPSSGGRIYLNYLSVSDKGEQGVRSAFGTNYPRLAALKTKYDHTNFFRLNQNIKPAL